MNGNERELAGLDTRKTPGIEYLLMHLDTNTRSTKHRRSPAPTMMRASVYRASLHRTAVLISGRRYPPLASLRLFSLRNSGPQRSISFLFVRRGNKTRWRARWCRRRRLLLLMTARSAKRDRDGLRGREQRHG